MANPYLDLKKSIHEQTKADKRTAMRLALVYSLLSPLDTHYNNIAQLLEDKLRELSYNGQTVQLERLLNDSFDVSLRRIKIRHNLFDKDFLFNYEELQIKTYLYDYGELSNGTFGTSGTIGVQEYWYNVGENPGALNAGTNGTSGAITYDFEIVAPTELSGLEAQIISITKKYAQAGFLFRVVYTG